MKLKLFVGVVSLALSAVSVAEVQINPYANIKTGVSNLRSDVGLPKDFSASSVVLALAGGVNLRNDILGGRFEVEYSHYFRNNDRAHYANGIVNVEQKVSSDSLMFNSYLDLYAGDLVNFYGFVGAGYAWSKETISLTVTGIDGKLSGSDKFNGFSWQTGLGVMFNVTENFSIDAGFRYTNLYDKDDIKIDARTGFLGFSYKF